MAPPANEPGMAKGEPSGWVRWADLTARRPRLLLGVALLATLFFTYFLLQTEVSTDIKAFHRKDSKQLIDTIEENFQEGSLISLTFESQSDRSLFHPELLKQQLKILQEIEEKFPVKADSLVKGIDETLKRVKRLSLLEIKNFNPIGAGLMAMAGPRTVRDLERVSHHLLSNPEAVAFYERFRVAAQVGVPGGGEGQWKYEIPDVKAIQARLQYQGLSTPEKQGQAEVEIRELLERGSTKELKAHAISDFLVAYDVDSLSKQNMPLMGLILLVVDTLILLLIFRRGGEVLLTMFIMITSCIWTFGMAGLFGIRLSFLHIIALPILLGTGIDDSVVFAMRYGEERARAQDFREALRVTYFGTGRGIFLTTFTTFAAFLCGSIMSASPMIQSFYYLVCLAMVVVFVLTVLLQGPLRTELEKRGKMQSTNPLKPASPLIQTLLQGLPRLASRWITQRSRWIVLIFGLLFLITLSMVGKLQTEFDERIYLSKGLPTYTANELLEKYFKASDPGYVLIEGEVENPLLLQKMKLLEQAMDKLPRIEKILTKVNVESVNELIDKMRVRITPKTNVREVLDRITTSDQTANYVLNESYQEVSKHLVHKTGEKYDGLLMKFFVEGTDGAQTRATVRALEEGIARLGFEDIPGIKVRVGGGKIAYHIEEGYYFGSFLKSFFVSLFINFLVLLLFWRHWGDAAFAMIPLVMSIAFSIGIMVLFDIKLNVLNLSVGAIVVGLGIDYPIHIIERFNEEQNKAAGRASRPKSTRFTFFHRKRKFPQSARLSAAKSSIAAMGPNIFGSSLTTIIGFSSAAVMALPIAQSFGLLVAVLILFVYLASIFLLPVLLTKGFSFSKEG